MPPNNYRRRRAPHGPSKNELRAARREKAGLAQADTLRQRFPNVNGLRLDIRMERSTGLSLGQESRMFGPDEPLILQIPCPSTCGNGQFNLIDALKESVNMSKESQEGLTICQTASYMDPRVACGTKLYYHFTIAYKGEQHA